MHATTSGSGRNFISQPQAGQLRCPLPPSVSPFVSLVLLLSCCREDFEHIAEVSEISLGGIKFEKIEAVEGIALDGSRKKGGKRCSNSGRSTADFKKSMITPARSRPISERERDVLLEKWASCSRLFFVALLHLEGALPNQARTCSIR